MTTEGRTGHLYGSEKTGLGIKPGRLTAEQQAQVVMHAYSLGEVANLSRGLQKVVTLRYPPDGSIRPIEIIAKELRRPERSVEVQISAGVTTLKNVLYKDSLDILHPDQAFVKEALEAGDINVLSPKRRKLLTERFLSPDGKVRPYEDTTVNSKKNINAIKAMERMSLRILIRAKTARELIARQEELSIEAKMTKIFIKGLLDIREIGKMFKMNRIEAERRIRGYLVSLEKDKSDSGLLQKPEK